MREQFEKLPVIDKILKGKRLRWNNKTKCYTGLDGKYCDDANPVNLAWYAFQEQQRRIDSIRDLAQSELDRWNKDKESDQIAKGITIAFNSTIYHIKHIKEFLK